LSSTPLPSLSRMAKRSLAFSCTLIGSIARSGTMVGEEGRHGDGDGREQMRAQKRGKNARDSWVITEWGCNMRNEQIGAHVRERARTAGLLAARAGRLNVGVFRSQSMPRPANC
jgi:hypothetical protein